MDLVTAIPRVLNSEARLNYCENPFSYHRRATREVMVGDVGIGAHHPIRIQSMTTTDTLDTEGTVRQVIELVEAGCEIVRITAPSIREAENLKHIRDVLRKQRIKVPLVADIHFTPNAAMKAAEVVEKIRINPGNYADKKKFAVLEYSESEYEHELERIEETFRPLVLRCKEYGLAMRIGTNHGSLSDRIMNRYGDTPLGMVESALEFVRICEHHNYHNIVLSMKSSNVQVMIAAYRLLAARLRELGMDYPFHLGVTEAGDGEDGRIKSAIGIGSLLEDGLGDTIRVSLTEDSVREIPAAYTIARKYNAWNEHPPMTDLVEIQEARDPYHHNRRWSQTVELPAFNLGGVHHVRVELALGVRVSDTPAALDAIRKMADAGKDDTAKAEIIRCEVFTENDAVSLQKLYHLLADEHIPVALSADVRNDFALARTTLPFCDIIIFAPARSSDEHEWKDQVVSVIEDAKKYEKKALQFNVRESDVPEFLCGALSAAEAMADTATEFAKICFAHDFKKGLISLVHPRTIAAYRLLAAKLHEAHLETPISLHYAAHAERSTLFEASITLGSLLCDGIGDTMIVEDPGMTAPDLVRLNYNILQAARLRISKTEFISCPSCGRTLFDLQEVTARIKSKTGHLKGVKIAIMGCIVNGPGEMADADFGYVGASAGKINLYVGKELVERNIDMAAADQRLIELIKNRNMWAEPKK
jgi:(E)-4-hydroxy-3-methylbut-2-enyl-diphosphate synthase